MSEAGQPIAEQRIVNGACARTLLIVDDRDSVRQTLDYVFRLHGLQTIVADSGTAALKLAEEARFDAALIDLHMSGMDGLSLCHALRTQARACGGDLPVWIMTAAFVPAIARAATEAGAIDVLRKPFPIYEFLAALEEFCAGRRPIPPFAARPAAAGGSVDPAFEPAPRSSESATVPR